MINIGAIIVGWIMISMGAALILFGVMNIIAALKGG